MRISKSHYQKFLECEKRFWLSLHREDLRPSPNANEQLRFETGREVGEMARRMFPNGRPGASGADVLEATRENMALLAAGHTLFEATFSDGDLLMRADIIVPENGGVTLIEVKSGTKPDKPDYTTDLGFQFHLLRRLGVPVTAAKILHLNPNFRSKKDVTSDEDWPLDELFMLTDRTHAVVEGGFWQEMERAVAKAAEPEPEPKFTHECRGCDYEAYCTVEEPPGAIWRMAGLRGSQIARFHQSGIFTVHDLATLDDLPAQNQLQARAIREDIDVTARHFVERFRSLKFCIGFVDFEGVSHALPRFQGHKPYENLPFQWSLHRMRHYDDDAPEHLEYLHEEPTDPSAAFTATLLEAIQGCETLVFYSGYETQMVRSLVNRGVPYADELLRLFSTRGFDLYGAIRKSCYWRSFGSSLSIKSVLPAVAPGVSYDGLAVKNGAEAVAQYVRMTSPDTPESERRAIAAALREYCALDTMAMVHVYRGLRDATPTD